MIIANAILLQGGIREFLPTSFSGLQWWYSPRLESAYVNDQQVNSLTDWSGNLQHLTRPLNTLCPLYKTDVLGQRCLLWDGVDDLITNNAAVPKNRGSFLHEGDFTLIAFINPTNVGVTGYLIDTNNGSATAKGMWVRVMATGRIQILIANGTGAVYNLVTPTSTLQVNQWQVLVIRNMASAPNNLQIYLDNVLVAQANPSASYVAGDPASSFVAHGNKATPTEAWEGYTGDVLAYDRALSDSELTNLLGGLNFE